MTAKSGSTVVGTCTTDATGCCTIASLAAGTYTIVVTNAAGETLYSASRTVTVGSTVTITPTCCATICLKNCSNLAMACAGITITLKSGGTTVFSGNTDSSGCVYAAIKVGGGTYTISMANLPPSYTYAPTAVALSCGSNTISPPSATGYGGCFCCNGVWDKDTMTLTDANGSHAFVATTVGGVCQMYACYGLGKANVVDRACAGTATTLNISIWYTGNCVNVGGVNMFQVVRHWFAYSPSGTAGDPGNLYNTDSAGGTCTNTTCQCPHIVAGSGDCGGTGLNGDSATVNFSLTSCNDFGPFSGTPAPYSGNWMPDPVGGTIAIS